MNDKEPKPISPHAVRIELERLNTESTDIMDMSRGLIAFFAGKAVAHPHAAGQEALVHAVLYLAEQQRIGNILEACKYFGGNRVLADPQTPDDLPPELAALLGLPLGVSHD